MKTKFANKQWTCRFALAGITLMGLPVLGQELETSAVPTAPLEQPAAQQPARLPITPSAGLSEQFNTKIDGTDGSFSITRFNLGLKAPVRLSSDYQLATSFRYGMDSYNFNSVNNPPWHNINTLQAASVLQWRVNDAWTAYGGAFLKMSSDSDVALGKGATGGGLAGFNYKVNNALSLGAGLGVASQVQDKALVVPLITAKWQFAHNWRLDAGLTDIATMGYGLEVKWHFNDAWNFGFGAQYHRSRFRIPSPDGTGGDGAGQEKATTIYADATWHATPKVDVDGFAGFTAGGNLKVYNNGRDEVYAHNYSPAAILGVKGSVRF